MEALKEELSQYEAQLSQIQTAISVSADGPDRDNLISLEKDINELIKLTKDSIKVSEEEQTTQNDPLADEYKLFQAELDGLKSEESDDRTEPTPEMSNSKPGNVEDLVSELKEMEGMKCQAPFKYAWTDDVTYHNALIFCIETLDDVTNSDEIQVRVMFTNPTHKEMLPCPYYLDGECRFSDEKCRFSHGEKVFLNSLRDYREPDFDSLVEGRPVLAKREDGLWYRGVVKSIDGVKCVVKFESNAEEETQMQNILPLEGELESGESDDSDSDSSVDHQDEASKEEIVRRILMAPPSSALGEWEKFTKGFGSRIMAKMGYIHGAGLGKEGRGRVEPVSAVILPAGKSLDHCMMLREHSGGDKDFFKAERRLKQMQRKQEKMMQRSYEREKNRTDVFMFLNKNLGQVNSDSSDKKVKNPQKELKNESSRNLNVTSLQLAEEVRKVEKEMKSLKNSLSRHSAQSKEYNVLQDKLADRQTKLSQLKATEQRISNEQERRRDMKKLTVF